MVNLANICSKIARVFLRLSLVTKREVLYEVRKRHSHSLSLYKVSPYVVLVAAMNVPIWQCGKILAFQLLCCT